MDRPRKSLADFVVIALSPALIMALVGSLVFFLLEILYAGQYYGQLQWILFFFVFGAVLIARISMEGEIAHRAVMYASVLGLLVWLALLRFVEYPPDHPATDWAWAINLGLIALIWWCAHRLTWDCTLVDDTVDASGTGLLELTGLAKESAVESTSDEPEQPAIPEPPGDPETEAEEPGLSGWWQRYRRHRQEQQKKPHAPGTWVVYFSLAALPLYGLGQTQIPADEADRRRYVFGLLLVYSASGLGLLLTTCFLGLRRYLRQRQLRMPAAMTATWLFFGCSVILLMLLGASLLPRPGAPNPLLNWTGLFRSPDLDPSQQALGNNKPKEEDEGQARKASDPKDEKGRDAKGAADNKADEKTDPDKANPDAAEPKKDGPEKASGKGGGKEKEKKKGSGRSSSKTKSQKPPTPPADSMFNQLAAILKWIVLGILLLFIGFLVLRSGLRFLANFTKWAKTLLEAIRAWWEGFLGLWKKKAPHVPDEQASPPSPPRPWRQFRDPFLTGAADQMSAADLVRYSFEALEAWAGERDLGRLPRETPLEFAHRLGREFDDLVQGVNRLAGWYVHLAYARGKVPGFSRNELRDFWYQLVEVSERSHETVHQ